MKQLVITLALLCAFSSSIFAGDMPTGGIAPPSNETAAGLAGDIPSVGKSELSSEALSALLSVLSFLT